MNQSIATLVNHPHALEQVRQTPPQDLFLMIKDAGLEDSIELIELMSPSQIRVCLDLDAWQGYELRPQSLANWLEAIFAANTDKPAQIFRELDLELVSLLLKRYATVYELNEDDQIGELPGEHITTPDQKYLIAFRDDATDQNLIHYIKLAIEQLYERDMAFVLRLIEAVRWETDSPLEEEALKWRDGRMQDMGFAPMDESQKILAYVTNLSQHTNLTPNPSPPSGEGNKSSSLLLNNVAPESPFAKALSKLTREEQLRVQNELIVTSNRAHVALKRDLGDVDSLKATVTQTIHVVETALSYLSEGFENHSVQQLFQMGHSLALKIGRDFRAAMKNAELTVEDLTRLDHPLAEVVRGILQPEPLMFAGLSDVRRVDYRYFESIQDINMTNAAVAEALFRAILLGPKGLALTQGQDIKVTHGVLLGTALAHQILDQKPDATPLNATDLTHLRDRMERVGEGKRFKSADIDKCVKWIKAERAHSYVRVVLGAIETELSRISDVQVDPRFVTSVLSI